MTSTRHRWGDKARFINKTEQQCSRCEMVKVGRREVEGGHDVYWTEFWRDEERIDDGGLTPPCDFRCEQTAAGDACRPEGRHTFL
ncbi:hypothetical protein [Bradyrhizobium sp. SZCCHNRI2007]|uniref:hypothetical protein n=1 Tax=Bradyrhizobium sp. SZCCHNRI2007 TaxID=3057281 RepID=UPI0028E2A320|nr:hypothetical protein [Bradyrhizobium sp. SZCCHNRI2007]